MKSRRVITIVKCSNDFAIWYDKLFWKIIIYFINLQTFNNNDECVVTNDFCTLRNNELYYLSTLRFMSRLEIGFTLNFQVYLLIRKIIMARVFDCQFFYLYLFKFSFCSMFCKWWRFAYHVLLSRYEIQFIKKYGKHFWTDMIFVCEYLWL